MHFKKAKGNKRQTKKTNFELVLLQAHKILISLQYNDGCLYGHLKISSNFSVTGNDLNYRLNET